MTDLRVALVGVDHWYSALPLAEGVGSQDGLSLAGVWDADPDRAAYVAQRYGVGRVEADWRTLVDDPGIDAVMSFVMRCASRPRRRVSTSSPTSHWLCGWRMRRGWSRLSAGRELLFCRPSRGSGWGRGSSGFGSG